MRTPPLRRRSMHRPPPLRPRSTGTVDRLRAEHSPAGGFLSTITHRDGRTEIDRNGFTTALTLRGLQGLDGPDGLDDIRRASLDFLERCADPRIPGAYGFWPPDERPGWARGIPADVDDTAVIALELLRGRRRTLRQTRDVVYRVLASALVTRRATLAPSWLRPLVFATWLGGGPGPQDNLVDCAANANVLALLAAVDLRHLPGYQAAAEMITEGVAWARSADPTRRALHLRSLTPYYPDPAWFLGMIDHAIACGADALRPARRMLAPLLPHVRVAPARRGAVCSDAYTGPYWHSRSLDLVGCLATQRRKSTAPDAAGCVLGH